MHKLPFDSILFDLDGTLLNMQATETARHFLLIPKVIIEKLAQEYRLGIFSGAARAEVYELLKRADLFPQPFNIGNIVAKEDVKQSKPSPEGLFLCVAKLEAKKPVYVGDGVNDLLSAKEAHIPFMSVETLIALL